MTKILVPTDFSRCSLAALKHAATLVKSDQDSLLILNVIESGASFVPDPKADPDPLRQDVFLLLESFAKSTPPIRFEERRIEGVPIASILSMAELESVDMIVIGSSGRTGLKRFILGSVAESVSRRAKCPVVIVKSTIDEKTHETSTSIWESLTTLPSATATPSGDLASKEINEHPTLALVARGIAARASDIHIDPTGQDYCVRFRIDGKMTNYCRLSEEVGRALITQIKVSGNLDIADPFHSKEGRLLLPESMNDYEVRVTIVPVIDGEAVSLRILSRTRLMRSMQQLGLSAEAQSRVVQILKHGEGLVLVTGPTGSGKTTTLYSLVHSLDDGSRNIVTIEDPVEFDIPTFRQLPVDPKHGTTMTNGLRTLLRLDPDVVFVGEIRDVEAAETAMRAASSGKYVFSSLHTRDVASTVTALRDLHIDNRSISGNIGGIISQRLLRRLCVDCCRSAAPTAEEANEFLAHDMTPPETIRHPVGCPKCRGTGYQDRIGIFEVVTSSDEIIRAIEDGSPEEDLRHLMRLQGVTTLTKDALHKVAEGVISFEECASMSAITFDHVPVEAVT